MVWKEGVAKPERYLISCGRSKERQYVLDNLREMVDTTEHETLQDLIWFALSEYLVRHQEQWSKEL